MVKFKGDDCSCLLHVSIGGVAADIAPVDAAVRARGRHLEEGPTPKTQLLLNSIKAAPENENLTTTNWEPGEHTFKSWSQTKRCYLIALKPEE